VNFTKIEIRSAIPIFVALLALLLSNCVWAKDKALSKSVLDAIIERGEIRVGMTADYKPFSYINKSQKHGVAGLDVDLATDLAKSLGVNTSWPALIADLKSQRFDIAMSGITIRLDRQQVGLFSNPIMSSGKAAIT